MASSPQSAQPIFFRQVVDATDEELTQLILHHPWYIKPKNEWSEPPEFELKPGENRPSHKERENLRKRFWRLRKEALAPPYPITEERLELAGRWRRVLKSIPPGPLVYDSPLVYDTPREPFIGPHNHRDVLARSREKTGYELLLELGGRPVYPLDRLFNDDTNYHGRRNPTEESLQPWKHFHEHSVPRPYSLRWWESSILQLKNWERFRTWQRDHRGPNDQDNFEAFVQEQHRDRKLLRAPDYSDWCLEMEDQPTSLWGAWEKRQHDRETHREQGCGSFTDYSEAARRRLEKNGFHHPFQLHPDPMQQDPLTTWIEYLAYEYWWLDHYTEALHGTQEKLLGVWERVDSHELFKTDEALVEEKPFKWVDAFNLQYRVFTYSPVLYFTATLPPSRLEEDFLWAEEVFKDAEAFSDIAKKQVEQERGREKPFYYKRPPAALKLDQLRRDCTQAKNEAYEEFKHFHFRRKYYHVLTDLTTKTLEQVEPRHWQRRIVNWALDELRLVEEEVRKLPGSSEIPMIAAKRGRKRARFTTAEPAIRLIPTRADEAKSSKRWSDKERKAKRLKLTLDEYPFPPGDRSMSSTSSIAGRLEWASESDSDASPAPTDGGSNDEQEGEDERRIVTGESSGQDKQASAEPIDDGGSNVQQEEDDGRQSATGESSEQGAAAETSSSSRTSRAEYQAALSPIQPDADKDDPTRRQCTPPASGNGDEQHLPQGAAGEQQAITDKVPAPRESQPPRRSARIIAKLAEQATALTDKLAARNDAEPQAQLKGKGKAKRPLSTPATLDADEPRPKRRRTHTAKQTTTAHGSAAGQGTLSSDGPGQHVPQEEDTIQDCITVSLSSLATGPPAAHRSQRAKPRKRATSRVNRSKRKA
ncbi:unnamed protein product [Clonostachys rhizophaga]|uniref:Uncharacterized protein n=1 Tax=Clonostachys rhizophaga TaxID=160324 RepID=A0A9N9YJT3_9HYPO|nr:unnamed protein product [Clonostachys rhizophaga]